MYPNQLVLKKNSLTEILNGRNGQKQTQRDLPSSGFHLIPSTSRTGSDQIQEPDTLGFHVYVWDPTT